MLKGKFACQQDLSEFKKLHQKLNQLSSKAVEYGYFGTEHYSGLNSATLAWILENGLGSGFPRDFMKSSALMASKNSTKLLKEVISILLSGGSVETALTKVGRYSVDNVKWIVWRGTFSNNTVSAAWAAVKGFDEALRHHGDLMNSTSYRIINN